MRHKTTGPLAPNELLQRPCPRWAVGFVELARGEHRCSRMLRTLRGWRRRGLEKVQSDVLDHKSELAVFSCVVLCKRLGRGEPEAVGETSAPESDACVICGICGGAGDSRRSSSDEVGLLPPPIFPKYIPVRREGMRGTHTAGVSATSLAAAGCCSSRSTELAKWKVNARESAKADSTAEAKAREQEGRVETARAVSLPAADYLHVSSGPRISPIPPDTSSSRCFLRRLLCSRTAISRHFTVPLLLHVQRHEIIRA